MLNILSHSILSVVYPQDCGICGREVESYDDGIACRACWEKTKIFSEQDTLCIKCGAFLFGARESRRDTTDCQRCSDHYYDRSVAVGTYHEALSLTVLRLKRIEKIPPLIKRLVLEKLDSLEAAPESLLVPVPLSKRRLRERGFNQAAVIARMIGQYRDLEIDETSLVRQVHTPMHRAGMDRKARASTVKSAFKVVRPNLIAGRDVVLIDDVLTSGETVSSCAKELKESGAAKVLVITIARAA